MKKLTLTALWAAALLALSAVTAFADEILPPEPAKPDSTLLIVLIVAVAVIAAAVIAWVIARRRRK